MNRTFISCCGQTWNCLGTFNRCYAGWTYRRKKQTEDTTRACADNYVPVRVKNAQMPKRDTCWKEATWRVNSRDIIWGVTLSCGHVFTCISNLTYFWSMAHTEVLRENVRIAMGLYTKAAWDYRLKESVLATCRVFKDLVLFKRNAATRCVSHPPTRLKFEYQATVANESRMFAWSERVPWSYSQWTQCRSQVRLLWGNSFNPVARVSDYLYAWYR